MTSLLEYAVMHDLMTIARACGVSDREIAEMRITFPKQDALERIESLEARINSATPASAQGLQDELEEEKEAFDSLSEVQIILMGDDEEPSAELIKMAKLLYNNVGPAYYKSEEADAEPNIYDIYCSEFSEVSQGIKQAATMAQQQAPWANRVS